VLAERKQATEGARKSAAEALSRAEGKAAAYEESIRSARNEMYQEQEILRRKWREEQAAQIAGARSATEAQVKAAKDEMAAQVAEARQSLEANSWQLADEIAEAVLAGRAR
jgi:dGTP triphosphohydrolase